MKSNQTHRASRRVSFFSIEQNVRKVRWSAARQHSGK